MSHEISFQLPLHNVLSRQVIRHDPSISCHKLLSVLCSDNRLFGYRFYAGISDISLYPVFLLMLRTAQMLSALLQDNLYHDNIYIRGLSSRLCFRLSLYLSSFVSSLASYLMISFTMVGVLPALCKLSNTMISSGFSIGLPSFSFAILIPFLTLFFNSLHHFICIYTILVLLHSIKAQSLH